MDGVGASPDGIHPGCDPRNAGQMKVGGNVSVGRCPRGSPGAHRGEITQSAAHTVLRCYPVSEHPSNRGESSGSQGTEPQPRKQRECLENPSSTAT